MSRTQAGHRSPYYTGADPVEALQWHVAEVKSLPPGADCLVESGDCAIQAMSMPGAVLSIQYHAEVTTDTLPAWCQSEGTAATLTERFGPDGLGHFQRIAGTAMPTLNDHARQLFQNWFYAAQRALSST